MKVDPLIEHLRLQQTFEKAVHQIRHQYMMAKVRCQQSDVTSEMSSYDGNAHVNWIMPMIMIAFILYTYTLYFKYVFIVLCSLAMVITQIPVWKVFGHSDGSTQLGRVWGSCHRFNIVVVLLVVILVTTSMLMPAVIAYFSPNLFSMRNVEQKLKEMGGWNERITNNNGSITRRTASVLFSAWR